MAYLRELGGLATRRRRYRLGGRAVLRRGRGADGRQLGGAVGAEPGGPVGRPGPGRHGRPAALLDERAAVPGTERLERRELRGGVGGGLEAVDADGRRELVAR